MNELNDRLKMECDVRVDERKIIKGENFRITVLTERLLRVERGKFYDGATQTVVFRNFPHFPFTIDDLGGSYVIKTARSEFVFLKKSGRFVKIVVDGKNLSLTDKGNLKGTCRTLDMRLGKVDLENGIISRGGVAFLYDNGMALNADGTLTERKNSCDYYLFAYGTDYKGALKDFFRLCGKVPMMPRYILGNWWSRYRAYTQDEYLGVMEKFEQKKIPFTVATVDMDWHWVKINEKFGCTFRSEHFGNSAGWTGYSWNTDLFPDYKKFLDTLHNKGYHVTLNLHPASGVRYFEDKYKEMAAAVGVDPETKSTVKFDLADSKFINAYFEILHHSYEKDGVNFWWIDWQQGKKCSVEGLDPLWALNHYHYLDNNRDGKRGVILSRFAGAGSHRYPLGFSGDCITRWASLKFQPYMTITAGNIGYGWWSHDIGGHNFGVYDDELYLRWLQFGVFSPVNRLHSSSHDLMGKEPWKHSSEVESAATEFLRLRHRLIPYLYTAMKRASDEGVPVCEPVYYEHPENDNAYKIKNEYYFGSELIVCPVTTKRLKSINMAKTDIWVPKGRYTDIFTGKIYNGEKIVTTFRDLDFIPVLAKEGAIIPLSADSGNDCGNPENMEILIYRGNNTYSLYEDDGETYAFEKGEYAYTDFTVTEADGKITFTVGEPRYGKENGEFTVPTDRKFILNFKDIKGGKIYINGIETELTAIGYCDTVEITDYVTAENGAPLDNARDILSRVQGNNINRMIKYRGLSKITDLDTLLKKIRARFGRDIYLAAKE